MRIAFITYTFPPQIGGMQNWSHQMAEAYSIAGHQVDVYHLVRGISKHNSRHYNYKPFLIDKETDQTNVPVQYYSVRLFLKTLYFLLTNLKNLYTYDIWQITVGEPQLLRILLTVFSYLSSVKVIAASGNVIFRSRYNKFTKPLKFALAKFVLNRANAILVDGVDIKKECEEQHIDSNKIRICYAGVDTSYFTPHEDRNLFQDYILKHNKPYTAGVRTILYSCRFSWENSPNIFLDAIQNIKNVQIIMVGNGPMMDELQKQALKARSPVHFWGALPYKDLPIIYSNVDICLYPFSKYIGGISQVIPLSMSCGAAVITTDIGDNKALIQNRINGFLTEEGDTDSMLSIINEILSGNIDLKKIKKYARETIVKQWSIERRNEEYAVFLKTL